MKLIICWILYFLVVIFGLLPISFTFRTADLDKPNVLLIERQECGCPCAEGKIIRGSLYFSDSINNLYPALNENEKEITLTNFPPFDNLSSDNTMTFDFAFSNTFKVEGEVIGIDTILCDPTNCEIVPKFQVSKWNTTTYYPRFWLFDKSIFFIYWIFIFLTFPTLTVMTVRKLIKRKSTKKMAGRN